MTLRTMASLVLVLAIFPAIASAADPASPGEPARPAKKPPIQLPANAEELAPLVEGFLKQLEEPAAGDKADADKAKEELFKKFTESMRGVKLTGKFTVDGKEGDPKMEEYTIVSVAKLPVGDLWLITARIKYGEKDMTIPMPLEVKWAGDTPVITLTNTTIPGMGTFSARVLFHEGRYAGTWQHDKVGGTLAGTISKVEKPAEEPKPATPAAP